MGDTTADRRRAMQHYLATVPVMSDYVDQIAVHLGDSPARRAQLTDLLRPYQDTIERAHIEVMVEHLSTEEILALATFQASRAGRAIMRKMGAVGADLVPRLSRLLKAVAEDAQRGQAP